MAKRSPNRAKAFEIWKASDGEKKLKEIAQELGVSDTQIRKWKSEDQWEHMNSNVTNEKSNVTIERRERKKKKEKIMKKIVESVEANDELNERQRLFCIHYANSNNATQSYLKVYDCDYNTAMVNGWNQLRKAKIKDEISRLKQIMRSEIDMDVVDLLNYCMKVVGADIGDYVRFGTENVTVTDEVGNEQKYKESYAHFADSDRVDTSLIEEVKQGKSGVSLKLADKKWAWEQIKQYFDWLPDKHRRKIEEAKVDIAREKIKKPETPQAPLILQAVYGKPDEQHEHE